MGSLVAALAFRMGSRRVAGATYRAAAALACAPGMEPRRDLRPGISAGRCASEEDGPGQAGPGGKRKRGRASGACALRA